MIFRGIGHAVKQACKQIFRNRAMTFASFFSITAMLLILGLFFIVVVNVNMVAENAKKQFDTIQVYLLEDTSEESVNQMIDKLEGMEQVTKAEYLSKEDALNEFKVKWGDKAYLLDGLSKNPLPNSIRIKLNDIEKAEAVVEKAKTFEGIEDIRYYQSTVDKLIHITDLIKIGASVIIVFLVVISVVVVSNTVKLTVLAREREISIMKYVGATNWFIRGPFLVEGIIIGFFSAGIAVALVAILYKKVLTLFSQDAFLLFSTSMVPEAFLVKNLVVIFMALGISIGAIGSIISMRRFLDT
ncbi:MAG: permease-like cell division protein FtsX [Eubacteriales bacterium]|nr:permease-like cell division protein FtsX [Eubacteriales bacterium]MDD3350093.1 permease-like cell division protein FtsX [Eubacteriales bacterium]